jgi:hypothetical protein
MDAIMQWDQLVLAPQNIGGLKACAVLHLLGQRIFLRHARGVLVRGCGPGRAIGLLVTNSSNCS